ncbi:DUF2059 domain-containing protein [Variovorax boronicumulans]|uniref:DUF2059 domain-containing protein n=1 Tax=Variovorax boronicumulans TaxID=436515 RepID=UPI00339362AA
MQSLSKLLVPLCLALTIFSPVASEAAGSDRKAALATQLTELMQVERSASEYLAECSKPQGSPFDPKRIFSVEPGYFGGISPQSAYWPEVVELYARYQSRACHSVSAAKFAAFFAAQYENKLSEEELDAAVSFFSSSAGRRYNAASVEANLALQTYLTKQMAEIVSVAFKDVQSDLRLILAKYKKDPR